MALGTIANRERYNNTTVNVYFENKGVADANKVNVRFYDADKSKGYVNIGIDRSTEITSRYEMNAVLEEVTKSPYYSKNQFGSKSFMRAQWLAHNICYTIAQQGSIGYKAMQLVSGLSNPIESASVLDIRSRGNMLRRQKLAYTILSFVA